MIIAMRTYICFDVLEARTRAFIMTLMRGNRANVSWSTCSDKYWNTLNGNFVFFIPRQTKIGHDESEWFGGRVERDCELWVTDWRAKLLVYMDQLNAKLNLLITRAKAAWMGTGEHDDGDDGDGSAFRDWLITNRICQNMFIHRTRKRYTTNSNSITILFLHFTLFGDLTRNRFGQ